jgi:prevent-host-death family protein
MKTVGNREFKNRLGRYLKMVVEGETLTVTNRGKAVARVIPLKPEEEDHLTTVEDVLTRLEAEGLLRRAKGTFKDRKFKPVVTGGKPASQMIIEDRE